MLAPRTYTESEVLRKGVNGKLQVREDRVGWTRFWVVEDQAGCRFATIPGGFLEADIQAGRYIAEFIVSAWEHKGTPDG